MLSEQIAEIKCRIERSEIGLKDALSIIDMILEDQGTGVEAPSPYEAFSDLNRLIDVTVHGAKVERFKPRSNHRPFHTLEIHTEDGDVLGHLNMIFMKRVIPCYYLVYVDVMPRFRGLGLGNGIIRAFMEFLEHKKAVGLLDNIIPPEDVTYEIYTRLGWKKVGDCFGNGLADGTANYMLFVPESIQVHDLKDKVIRLLFNLRKKRPVIDMHDNEDMVKRTIEEFRSIYRALEELFRGEISSGTSSPLMRFMFTRLTTKLIGFRRRIAELIGYTGGESLEQISLSGPVRELPIQPYSLWNLGKDHVGIWGDDTVLHDMPDRLKETPTSFIEELPFYKRPYFYGWTEKAVTYPSRPLKISDLLDLGFDPTRLREFHHQGLNYIFERISPHFFQSLVKKEKFLRKIEESGSKQRFHGAALRINPPLLIFLDKGNVYVLRKKVAGVHSQEAFDQLKTSPRLREMNEAVGVDRTMVKTINEIKKWMETRFRSRFRQEIEDLTYFLPWDIETNFPRVRVEVSGISLDTVWIA
jgi:hypothetical protein